MVIYPHLSANRKRYWRRSHYQIRAIFGYEQNVFVENVVLNIIDNARCSIIGVISRLAVCARNRHPTAVQVLTDLVKPLAGPFFRIGFWIAKQFDKSGLAISRCIFCEKSLHCSDSPLRTALWYQFWRDREAAAPVLSAFLCRWRALPAFYGTYADAPL